MKRYDVYSGKERIGFIIAKNEKLAIKEAIRYYGAEYADLSVILLPPHRKVNHA